MVAGHLELALANDSQNGGCLNLLKCDFGRDRVRFPHGNGDTDLD